VDPVNTGDQASPQTIRFLLVALPAGVPATQLDYAERLGQRSAVAARIADLLPGTIFDAQARGTFARAGYRITFTLVGEDPTAVVVEVDGTEGLAPIKRVTDRTGWRAVDTEARRFIDLEASRATGTIVHVPATEMNGQPDAARSPLNRRLWHAALLVLIAGGMWVSWEWSRRVTRIPRPPASRFAAEGLSVLSAARLAATQRREPVEMSAKTPPAKAQAETIQALTAQLGPNVTRGRNRILYTKLLAPEFRADPIAQQMVDYSIASSLFPGSLGESGFLPPERLSDPGLFKALGVAAYLPPSFASSRRDGYVFEFEGHDCNRPMRMLQQIGNVCSGFVYRARPVTARSGARSFALFSADDRIHYRTDGAPPDRTDPTVDNTAPSSAADLPGAGITLGAHADSAVARRLLTAMNSVARAAGFKDAAGATVAMHEQSAIADLRQVAAAEATLMAMAAQGYAAPERLADASGYADERLRPLLPGYFVQAQRQGYKFEFQGELPMPSDGSSTSFGPLYQAFVYSAVPIDPGPEGRRAFALHANGQIYVTAERRTPTTNDPLLRR
jgi:hypothetical protein